MDNEKITLNGADMLRRVTVSIRMPRMISARFTVAAWLFRLAGWVSGTSVVVDVYEGTDDHQDAASDWYVQSKGKAQTPLSGQI